MAIKLVYSLWPRLWAIMGMGGMGHGHGPRLTTDNWNGRMVWCIKLLKGNKHWQSMLCLRPAHSFCGHMAHTTWQQSRKSQRLKLRQVQNTNWFSNGPCQCHPVQVVAFMMQWNQRYRWHQSSLRWHQSSLMHHQHRCSGTCRIWKPLWRQDQSSWTSHMWSAGVSLHSVKRGLSPRSVGLPRRLPLQKEKLALPARCLLQQKYVCFVKNQDQCWCQRLCHMVWCRLAVIKLHKKLVLAKLQQLCNLQLVPAKLDLQKQMLPAGLQKKGRLNKSLSGP